MKETNLWNDEWMVVYMEIDPRGVWNVVGWDLISRDEIEYRFLKKMSSAYF